MLPPMSDAAPGPVEILLNGEPYPLSPDDTVARLVERLGLAEKRIAVAVNREVVPRSAFPEHALAGGDRVEILQAVGGGT